MKLEMSTGGGGYGWNISVLPPEGQHIAICLDVRDQFQVERPSFDNPQVMEKQDVTRFLFGFVAQDGRPYLVQTFEFTISGNTGSNLVKFLKSWLNKEPYGVDYSIECKNIGAMITVGRKQSRKDAAKWYGVVNSITPVYPQLQASIPQAHLFSQLVAQANTQAQQSAPGGQPSAPPPASHGAPPPAQAHVGNPRRFWVMPTPTAAAVEATEAQIIVGLAKGKAVYMICDMANPAAGWQVPSAFGINPPPPPQTQLPPPPPLPQQNFPPPPPPAATVQNPPPPPVNQQMPPPVNSGGLEDDIPF